MIKIIFIVVVFVVAFIIWRWTSVTRGARQRDETLVARLDPIGRKIEEGKPVAIQEIAELAACPEMRYYLFTVLREMKRPDLIPANVSSSIAQGESALAYWLMHPNELQAAPEVIEFVETIKRPVNGLDAEFHVYRYRMPKDHWAGKDGWILGVVGPMPVSVEPYSHMPGAFSRAGDTEGKVKPAELVDWYVQMLKKVSNVK